MLHAMAGRVVLDRRRALHSGQIRRKSVYVPASGSRPRFECSCRLRPISRLAIEQAFPTLVDVDLGAPNMAERIPTFDREFPLHSCHCPHRRLLFKEDGDGPARANIS
jgi:hypothetical protein